LQSSIQDVAFITLRYPRNIVANIRVSWLDPRKVRQITIVGDHKMVTWDDLAPLGPVTIYDKGVDKEPYYNSFGEFQLLPREGDVMIPRIRMEEPLKTQNQYFLRCLETGEAPMSDGQNGVMLVKILSAVNQSLSAGGQPISIR
jgi:predicted dehydrogenase